MDTFCDSFSGNWWTLSVDSFSGDHHTVLPALSGSLIYPKIIVPREIYRQLDLSSLAETTINGQLSLG